MRARPVVEALCRGALAFAANPLLVGAQVSLWLAVLVLGGISAAALVAGFRAPRGTFRRGARRHVAAFFWLLNIYALAATFLLTLAAVGVLALLFLLLVACGLAAGGVVSGPRVLV